MYREDKTKQYNAVVYFLIQFNHVMFSNCKRKTKGVIRNRKAKERQYKDKTIYKDLKSPILDPVIRRIQLEFGTW